jgi:chromate transporter
VKSDNTHSLSVAAREERSKELSALATLFLRLGVTAFGGPAAHIAMMEDEVVRRRGWMTHDRFLDLIGMTNLIPGPNSTEMAIHIGHERAGWRGLVVSGVAFIAPSTFITGGLAWAYVRFGARPQASAVLYGVKPVIIAVVAQALVSLTPKAAKGALLKAVGLLSLIAVALGANELICLATSGVLVAAMRRRTRSSVLGFGPLLSAGSGIAAAGKVAVAPFSQTGLFLMFAKVGAVLFGSGYVLLAFLRSDLVEHRHWLTEAQLLDAIAVGQVTPGPVFTTATFIGYVLGRTTGAALATIGIFLPAFFFVAVSGLLLPRIRRSESSRAFLDGVNVASLALMALVTAQLGRAAVVDLTTLALTAVSAVLLLGLKVNSTWLIAGGALVGIATQGIR